MTSQPYPQMFSPLTVGGMVFRNRVMAAPMTTARMVDDTRCPTDTAIDEYETRARGGVAAVTVTETFVDFDRGARHDHSLDLVSPGRSVRHLESLAVLAESIRAHGAVASIQLNHIGNVNHPAAIPGGRDPIGPSGFTRPDGVVVAEMDEAAIHEVADHFADAAAGAQAAGFDMVMLHGGHGWLLGQFLSPLTNHRTDAWGGDLAGRARFPLLVLDRIRETCPGLLIEYRLSGAERVPGGLEVAEAAAFARMISPHVDLVHVTSGLYLNHVASKAFSSMFHPHGCNLDLAAAVKAAVDVPVVAVGGFNHPEQVEQALVSGACDFVALGRQMLADPDFVAKAAAGRTDEIAPCLRCSCFNPLAPDPHARPAAKPFECTVNPWSMRGLRLRWAPPPRRAREVLVVGGGPGGMYAALTAAERGHAVTLLERADRLGGQLWFADRDPHKADLARYRDTLARRVELSGVRVETGVEASPATVAEWAPEVLVVAVGADPVVPDVPGLREHARHATAAYRDPDSVGHRVVIVGGGLVGVETGMHLAERLGCEVDVLELGADWARDAYPSHREAIELFRPPGLRISCGVRVLAVTADGVTVRDAAGHRFVPADTVLHAVGYAPRRDLAAALLAARPGGRLVGDCRRPARVLEAVRDGMFAGLDVV